jgi:clan AA aspartic protease (TIGR02281 family)
LDDSEAEEGTVLAAHENPELVDKELARRVSDGLEAERPLYLTYSIPKGQDLPSFVL